MAERLSPRVMGLWLLLALLVSAPASVAQAPSLGAPELLVYGFEPFGDFDHNPSAELALAMAQERSRRAAVVLPVSPAEALGALFAQMERRPKVIIGLGVRADVKALEVNTEATNWLSMRTPGELPFYGSIEPGLPAAIGLRPAFLSEVQVQVAALGDKARLSPDAGMHACNLTFFHALLHADAQARVIFIHVPPDIMARPTLLSALRKLIDGLASP